MATTNPNTIKRTYGQERTLGDIIYNPKTKSIFCSISLGFFGKTTITLIKRTDDGAYDLMKGYTDKQGNEQVICIGKTFPAKDKNQKIVEGITQGTLGLLKRYDEELKKEITDNSDALFITTHKLKEPKTLGESGFIKVGYLKGKFGIEITSSEPEVSTDKKVDTEEEEDYGF